MLPESKGRLACFIYQLQINKTLLENNITGTNACVCFFRYLTIAVAVRSLKRLDVWDICLHPTVIRALKCCMKTDGGNSQMGIKTTTEVQLKCGFDLSAEILL